MQDLMVGICVVAALLFVARSLWNKAGSQKQGGCCGCSGCPNRSPLQDGNCANADKGKVEAGRPDETDCGSPRNGM